MFETTLPWESYWISSNLPHCWARPLTPLWLAVECIQFLKTVQLTMRFAIIAVSHFHLESIQFVSAKQQHSKTKKFFLISGNNIRVSRVVVFLFFLPHVEDWALIAARICSLTSALLNATAQYSSIYEKESFKSKRGKSESRVCFKCRNSSRWNVSREQQRINTTSLTAQVGFSPAIKLFCVSLPPKTCLWMI